MKLSFFSLSTGIGLAFELRQVYTCISVFLISSYGAPLAHRASHLALHSSLFGPVA